MTSTYPISFTLNDGTVVKVFRQDENCYEFYLSRLNSEKHNFMLVQGKIEESYETRFDELQHEAVSVFMQLKPSSGA